MYPIAVAQMYARGRHVCIACIAKQPIGAFQVSGQATMATSLATAQIVAAELIAIILGQCKRPEEREFYLRLAVREHWSSRELERQLKGALFERTVLHPPKASQVIRQTHAEALSVFKDAYLVEFLDLPAEHAESDLHRGLLLKLKDFLIELGRDFCFAGSEFPVQVGGRDFALDLLFFHRGLNCLVAIELKVGRFEPEYLGKLRARKGGRQQDHLYGGRA